MPLDWTDIQFQNGASKAAGLVETQYYAPLSYFTLPLPIPGAATTPGDLVKLVGAFTFVATKHWKKIFCSRDEGDIKDTLVGGTDSQSWKSEVQLWLPGQYAENLGFVQLAKDTQLILLIVQSDGTMKLLGSDVCPARLESAGIQSDVKTSGKNGTMLKFSCLLNTPAPLYTGAIALS